MRRAHAESLGYAAQTRLGFGLRGRDLGAVGCTAVACKWPSNFPSCHLGLSAGHQDTTFVGFDVSQRQPNLVRSMREDLAKRVKWVHGNLYVLALNAHADRSV